MTLKQGQSHQTYSETIDPEQRYNHEEFERPRFNGVREKVNVKDFFQRWKYVNSPLNIRENLKKWYILIYLT